MLALLYKGYTRLLLLGAWGAALLLGGMALLIAVDVALRTLGWGNLPWSVEIVEYILFVATFLAAPWVLHERAHVRVDVLERILPPLWSRALEQLAATVGLLICSMLIYYGGGAAWEAYFLKARIFKQLVVAEWWLLVLIPLTGLLLGIEFLLRLLGAPEAERSGAVPRAVL